MNLRELVETELRTGLVRLQGTRVEAMMPVSQALIDEVLPLVPGVPANVAVTLGADRLVQVRYGAFHADARVRPEVTFTPAPVVTLDLSSQLVAFGLRRLPLPPFVRVSGRAVQVHLAEIPALRDAQAVWPHVEQISFISLAGRLEVTIRLHVKSDGMPRPSDGVARGADAPGSGPSVSRLAEWSQRQLDAGLPAIAGARVSARLQVAVALVNDWLASGVAEITDAMARHSDGGTSSKVGALVARLVRQVRIDAAPGAIMLDLEACVDG